MANAPACWVGNKDGLSGPYIRKVLCAAGSTRTIERGDICVLNSSDQAVTIASDATHFGDIVIANQEIKASYRAGYYEFIIPRPSDIFEYALSSAAAIAHGTPVGYSAAKTVSSSATYAFAEAVGQEHYPQYQAHLGDDIRGNSGTTVLNTSYARISFYDVASAFIRFQTPSVMALSVTVTAGGAEDETIVAAAPFKFKIIDAWMVSRDTNAANVTLDDGTNNITNTQAKGGTDDAIVRFTSLVAEYDAISKAGAVDAAFSAAGSVDVNLLIIPVI